MPARTLLARALGAAAARRHDQALSLAREAIRVNDAQGPERIPVAAHVLRIARGALTGDALADWLVEVIDTNMLLEAEFYLALAELRVRPPADPAARGPLTAASNLLARGAALTGDRRVADAYAESLRLLGLQDEATRALERATAVARSSDWNGLRLQAEEALAQGHPGRADHLARAALQRLTATAEEWNAPGLLYLRARARATEGDAEEALALLEEAVRTPGGMPVGLLRDLARALLAAGSPEGARARLLQHLHDVARDDDALALLSELDGGPLVFPAELADTLPWPAARFFGDVDAEVDRWSPVSGSSHTGLHARDTGTVVGGGSAAPLLSPSGRRVATIGTGQGVLQVGTFDGPNVTATAWTTYREGAGREARLIGWVGEDRLLVGITEGPSLVVHLLTREGEGSVREDLLHIPRIDAIAPDVDRVYSMETDEEETRILAHDLQGHSLVWRRVPGPVRAMAAAPGGAAWLVRPDGLWYAARSGGLHRRVAGEGIDRPCVSPDGSRVAFVWADPAVRPFAPRLHVFDENQRTIPLSAWCGGPGFHWLDDEALIYTGNVSMVAVISLRRPRDPYFTSLHATAVGRGTHTGVWPRMSP